MKTKIIIVFLLLVCVGLGAVLIKTHFFPEPTPETIDKVDRLNKLSGAQKLVLAEQYHYHEYKKKVKKGILGSAVVLIRWEAKYEYIIDLAKNALDIKRKGSDLIVVAPPIELNDPKINLKKYSPIKIKGNLFVNEDKLIWQEQRKLMEYSRNFGKKFVYTKEVRKIVHDQLRLFVLKLAAQLELKVDSVHVTFKKDTKKINPL